MSSSVRRFLVLTILLLLALPAAADAAVRHVVRGAGWGHGIGMSQYGARGFAENGKGYAEILRHYYRGAELSKHDGAPVRVLLQAGRKEILFTGATRVPGERLDPARTYRARPTSLGKVQILTAGEKEVGEFDAPLQVSSAEGNVLLKGTAINGLTNGRYRGNINLHPGTFGGISAVNSLPLDLYVQGVVPGEMPSSWHPEALKAQAVAARSYALATRKTSGIFDQYPDVRSQVYRGLSGEAASTNAAVEATADEILRHGGDIVVTYFFSTSGGRTENVENVFYAATPKPYLVSVEDPHDDLSPRHRWRFTFTTRQMQAKLGGLVKGRFRRIKVVARGESPRVVWADIYGSRGRTRVRGATLRAELGLHDTWAYFTRVSTKAARSSVRRSSWLGRLMTAHRERRSVRLVRGSIVPRPRGGRIVVERRSGEGWRAVRRAVTRRDGSFRLRVRQRGVYRVRAGSVSGPDVTVR